MAPLTLAQRVTYIALLLARRLAVAALAPPYMLPLSCSTVASAQAGMGQRFTAPSDRGAGPADGRLGLTAAEAEQALEERLVALSDRARRIQQAVARLLADGPSAHAVQRVHDMVEELDDEIVELLVDVDYTRLVPDPVPAQYERRS